MNSVKPNELKRGKIFLLCFDNRRSTDYSKIRFLTEKLASFGYYCDKVSRVAYDDSTEIVGAVKDAYENSENIIILCPERMGKTFIDFISQLSGAQFDNFGMLEKDGLSVFILFYDAENRLRYEDIKACLDKKYGIRYASTVIKAVGVSEKVIEEIAKSGVSGGFKINIKSEYDDCRIEIVYSSETPKMQLDEAVRQIVKTLGDSVYALEDVSLAEQLYRLLKLRRMKIAVAESFTGGGVGKKLVEVSGISEVYFEGLNTYSNESKMGRLGVSELTLRQCGAVSAETAYQMAEGLIKTGNCNVAISTTGIAGPKSDNTAKPVGLAFIGVAVGDDISVYKFNFTGGRDKISATAVNHALFLAYKELK